MLSKRFSWALEQLDINANDDILEIGFGSGILIGQMAKYINKGHIKGIEKSEKMIALAEKKNKFFIEKGVVELSHMEFNQIEKDEAMYDKIIAFNVNFFLKPSKKEMSLIKLLLKPFGKLFVFYQFPFEINLEKTKPIIKHLTDNKFKVLDTKIKKMHPVSSLFIMAEKVK